MMKYCKLVCLSVFFFGVASAGWAEGVTLAGRLVTVETPRFRATFDGLNLTVLENRLTGEAYAVPGNPAVQSAAMQALAKRSGIAIDSLRPAVPVRYYSLCDRTTISSEKIPGGLRVTYTGLAAEQVSLALPEQKAGAAAKGQDAPPVSALVARQEQEARDGRPDGLLEGVNTWAADFAPVMKLVVTFVVDAESGDLVITPEAYGNIEKVAGVRDRGVLRSGIQTHNLNGDLRLIIPADHGVVFTAATVPATWSTNPVPYLWPRRWEAALLIAEGQKGCFGIWADEPKLRYGRLLSTCRSGVSWGAGLEFVTTDLNYRCDELTRAAWRLNVFAGNWTRAAGRYREQMQKQWPDLKPLAQNKPGWADRVRLVVEPDLPDQQLMSSLTAFPRDSVAVFCREGWHLPWASFRDTPPKRGDTVWPAARPWEFSLPTNLPERIAALESKGLHVFPYANQNLLDGSWIMKPVGYESPFKETESRLYTWRVWARFFPEACQDQVELTGASGVCEGYSWVMGRYLGSEPPEENWYTGSLGMRKYLRELLPDTALMGDQVNEVTCRGQHLSRAVTADLQHAHPVSTFLFGPFTRQWSASAIPEVNAADDIHGFLQGWPSSWAAPTVPQQILGPSKGVQWQGGATVLPAEAQALLRTRGELFVKEQLVSVWPEQWDPRVLHYYQGKDGAEYRLLKDGGTRLVKVVGGKEETLYWRIGGVAEILAKGYAIPNWIGYDGDRVIGLKPDAVYLTQAAGSKPPVVISSLPKDIVIARTLHGAGYWLADLKNGSQGTGRPANLEDDESAPGSAASPLAAGDGKPVKSITLHVRGSGVPVSFAGAEAVKTLSADEYEVTMKSPGSLVAYWTNTANNITLKKEAYRLTLLRSQTGLESSIGAIAVNKDFMAPPVGSAEDGEESVLAWFVRMPLEQPWLVFKFGVGSEVFTQGVRYQVRVNGRTVWERLRREAEMKWNVDSMKLVKNPVRYGAVNMKEFEDKPVLVELIASAKDASALNWIKWENPQFMEQPPTWDAELDKPVDAPKLDAMPDLDVKH